MENHNTEKEIVMFYNVENLFSPDVKPIHKTNPTVSGLWNWDNRKYQNKLQKIAHVFELIKEEKACLPMFVGLSEIHNEKVMKDLITLPSFEGKFDFIHYESMDERGVDVALLYDKTKIEVIDSESISFFFEDENGLGDFDTTRDILFCKLKYQEEIINVFVFHLPSKREKDINKPKRDYILKEIKSKISALQDKREAVVICGDFNENPDAENISNLIYGNKFDNELVNPFLEIFQSKKYSTFHHAEGLLFDQIIFTEKLLKTKNKIAFEGAEIFNPDKICNWDKKFKGRPFRTYAGTRYLGGYSDHFPVLATFRKV